MKRRKNSIFLIAALAAIIIASAVLLSLSQKTFFPEKLGEMELKLYRNSAVEKVDNMTRGMGGMFSSPETSEIDEAIKSIGG